MWKSSVSVGFRAIHPKLWGNLAFPQNAHTRKLGEIYALWITSSSTNVLTL